MNSERCKRPRVFVVRDFSSMELEQTLQELAGQREIHYDLLVPGLAAKGGEILRDVVLPGIVESDRILVLADEPNANVGFEAGLAIGLGKPTAIVTWSAELPDWLQRPPFINTLVQHVKDLSMIETVLDNEDVWENPVARPEPSVGRPDLPSTKFLCPQGREGSFFNTVQLEVRPFWSRPPKQNFTVRDLPYFFHDALQLVWVLAKPEKEDDSRDGVDNACNGVVAGWYSAKVLAGEQQQPSVGQVRDRWELFTRSLRVLRQPACRPIRDVELLEKTFEGPAEFAQLLREIPDPRLNKTGPSVDFKPRRKQGEPPRPLPELLREQVRRIQVRSHELAGSGRFDRALDELQAGDELTASLVAEWPDDLDLKIMRGFLLKSLAQTFQAAGIEAHIASSRERAAAWLRGIIEDLGDDVERRLSEEHISALGNVAKAMGALLLGAGDLDGAHNHFAFATRIMPNDPYAWHDLFSTYLQRQRRHNENKHFAVIGEDQALDLIKRLESGGPSPTEPASDQSWFNRSAPVDIALIRQAFENMKAHGEGEPGLSSVYVRSLEEQLSVLERPMASDIKMFSDNACDLAREAIKGLLREDPELKAFRSRAEESAPLAPDVEIEAIVRQAADGNQEGARESWASLIQAREETCPAHDAYLARARSEYAELLVETDAQRSRQLADAAADADPLSAEAWRGIGSVRLHQGDPKGALSAYKKCAVLSELQGDHQRLVEVLQVLATIYRRMGSENDTDCLSMALGIANARGDRPTCAQLCLWLGRSYYAGGGILELLGGSLGLAFGFTESAVELFRQLEDQEGIADALADLALVEMKAGRLEETERRSREALKIYDQAGLRHKHANQYGPLGQVLMMQGRQSEAIKMWRRARDLWEEIGVPAQASAYEQYISQFKSAEDLKSDEDKR